MTDVMRLVHHRATCREPDWASASIPRCSITTSWTMAAYGVMQFIEGETLEARWAKALADPTGSLRHRRDGGVGAGGSARQNIIHRDIKPGQHHAQGTMKHRSAASARWCSTSESPKVSEGMAVTATGNLVGTPIYMAYEQGVRAGCRPARRCLFAGRGLTRCCAVACHSRTTGGDGMMVVLTAKTEESTPIEKYAPNLPAELRAGQRDGAGKDHCDGSQHGCRCARDAAKHSGRGPGRSRPAVMWRWGGRGSGYGPLITAATTITTLPAAAPAAGASRADSQRAKIKGRGSHRLRSACRRRFRCRHPAPASAAGPVRAN